MRCEVEENRHPREKIVEEGLRKIEEEMAIRKINRERKSKQRQREKLKKKLRRNY